MLESNKNEAKSWLNPIIAEEYAVVLHEYMHTLPFSLTLTDCLAVSISQRHPGIVQLSVFKNALLNNEISSFHTFVKHFMTQS